MFVCTLHNDILILPYFSCQIMEGSVRLFYRCSSSSMEGPVRLFSRCSSSSIEGSIRLFSRCSSSSMESPVRLFYKCSSSSMEGSVTYSVDALAHLWRVLSDLLVSTMWPFSHKMVFIYIHFTNTQFIKFTVLPWSLFYTKLLYTTWFKVSNKISYCSFFWLPSNVNKINVSINHCSLLWLEIWLKHFEMQG